MARAVQAEIPKFEIFGGMMRRKSEDAGNEVGMELKYCEHCGGLWVRERGAGTIYCDRCQTKVAELPAPKRRKSRLILPVRPPTAVDEYAIEVDREDVGEIGPDLEGLGVDAADLEGSDFDASDFDASDYEAGGAA
jgi:ribosomal protein L37AE/L43A